MCNVCINGVDQLRQAGEYSSAQLLGRNVTEEALHHIQPRCRGGRKVHRDARVLGQPVLNDWIIVGRLVIRDQVQRLVFGRFTLNLLDEVPDIAQGQTTTAIVQVRVNQTRFRRAILAS